MKRTVSLTENYLFRRMYRVGKCTVTPHVAVYVKKNRLGKNRLGITATKKIGGAVQRNRARRVIREAYRLIEPKMQGNRDIVIVARQKAVFSKMQEVRRSLEKVLLADGGSPKKPVPERQNAVTLE
ncbi:MAG: ribonuclease P protein component [Oscillospiraceae bacterium]